MSDKPFPGLRSLISESPGKPITFRELTAGTRELTEAMNQFVADMNAATNTMLEIGQILKPHHQLCPVCGENPLKDTLEFRRSIAAQIKAELINPGGRELHFIDGRRLQLADMCNACDEAKIRAFMSTKLWDVWIEGFVVNGSREPAKYLGQTEALSFRDAAEHVLQRCGFIINPPIFDRQRLTYYGCRLFDNEADARASFG